MFTICNVLGAAWNVPPLSKTGRIRNCFPIYTACLPPPVSCGCVASFPWEVVLVGTSQRRLPIWCHLPWSHWWWWGRWCCCIVKDWMGKALSLGTRTVFALYQCKKRKQDKTKTHLQMSELQSILQYCFAASSVEWLIEYCTKTPWN